MTAQLVEAQTAQTKAERECNSLRDGVRSLREAWAREVKSVREEFKKGEERGLREREEAVSKFIQLR
jgi:flagellar biosynthesis/type III secretory pathway protein FliH